MEFSSILSHHPVLRLQGLKMPQPDPPPLLGKDLAEAKISFRHKMRYNIRVIVSMVLWKSCEDIT